MGTIRLQNDATPSVTSVSNTFIDEYMSAANGEYVKIYLYLLRCMNQTDSEFSLSDAADRLDHTEKDITRALHYWEKMNLLVLEYDSNQVLSGIRLLDSAQAGQDSAAARNTTQAGQGSVAASSTVQTGQGSAAADSSARPDQRSVVQNGASQAGQGSASLKGTDSAGNTDFASQSQESHHTVRSFTADELDDLKKKESVQELLFVTERYVRHPLSTTDLNLLLSWYEDLKLSSDLIEYLVEYCVGKGHTSLRYMNKVALAWKNEGITTVAEAKEESSDYSKLYHTVLRSLGISNRTLIDAEIALVDKWSKTYGFSNDLISEACRRTIAAISQPSLEYADRILTRWNQNQVHDLGDIARLDLEHEKRSRKSQSRSGSGADGSGTDSAKVGTGRAGSSGSKAKSGNRFKNFEERSYDYDALEEQLQDLSCE